MHKSLLFTSESVSEGHPDKIADQVSDAVLDAILEQDAQARVACDVLVKTGMVVVCGEIKTQAWVDIESIVRKTVLDIGYNDAQMGFDGASCAVLTAIGQQSNDIACGVDKKAATDQGAGDQGLMFGYATNESANGMPTPLRFAHALMQKQAQLRHDNTLPWLRPDAKSQVTVRYVDDKPHSVDAVVVSTQHDASVPYPTLKEAVMECIIKPVIPAAWLTPHTRFHINPTGRFVVGGPLGDAGLTGRKVIVDTYGGMARHGGGCFSGKDPSKVDRSGAYMARYIAKNIVAAKLAARCEVQLSYAIGVAEPTSLYIETFGTSPYRADQLEAAVRACFDLRPYYLIRDLNLLRPIYKKTAVYGHFGRQPDLFHWEKTDRVGQLQDALQVHASHL